MTNVYETQCQNFLAISREYRLGNLQTEASHPQTESLSLLSKRAPKEALNLLKDVDILALDQLIQIYEKEKQLFWLLKKNIQETLTQGGRVFLVGCGSTGRLSLLLETLWRDTYKDSEQLVSFMAGGDLALIRAVEKFEDFPHYGKRQLQELSFGPKDMLIASTEGGETPFVMGAALFAAEVSHRNTFYVFCNPESLLKREVPRTNQVLSHDRITKIALPVGPQALSGSTRMQASTALLFYIGSALFLKEPPFVRFQSFLRQQDFGFLSQSLVEEADLIQNKGLVMYQGDLFTGMSILSDTTERAPTFGVSPFDHRKDTQNPLPSWCYLHLLDSRSSQDGWLKLLRRPPRTLEWPELNQVASFERLLGFDFSSIEVRKFAYKDYLFKIFPWVIEKGDLVIDQTYALSLNGLTDLEKLIFLKMLLNAYSTSLMGRLDRYEGNTMTWVRPSNYKLIDRSIRYADAILRREHRSYSYEELCLELFRWKDSLDTKESIVLKIVEKFRGN